MSGKRRIHLDHDAIVDARVRGDTFKEIGERFGCSTTTALRRVEGVRAYRCVQCEQNQAEVDRLRDAYLYLEEAMFILLNATRPGASSAALIERIEGTMGESSSSAAFRGEWTFT